MAYGFLENNLETRERSPQALFSDPKKEIFVIWRIQGTGLVWAKGP